ncbi:hypothetical protein CTAYLR_004985 [Chrysophaeum taylorii]|uniref:Carbohydrate kinase PfkB domain-containing protein n=1 Tax=Chrysophaeum taylorii TaxID=2483200 RepID=A0AAD7UD46_9STRA|nr:hypothetical protein CTAYLR_004985 [Chrysophaeum taylorii]
MVSSMMGFMLLAVRRRRRRRRVALRRVGVGAPERKYVVVGDSFVDVLASGVLELPSQWNADYLATQPIDLRSGGSAMNTAIHLRELSGSRVELHSAVGKDHFGAILKTAAADRGLDLVDHRRQPLGTGSCVVISGANDRTFLTYRGVVDALRGRDVDVSTSTHVHVAGYYNCPALQQDVPDLFRRARRAGATTSLGVQHDATGCWGGVGRPPLTVDDTGPDFLILSEDEARQVVDKIAPADDPTSWPQADALALLSSGAARCVVLTVGAEGAILAGRDDNNRNILLHQRAATAPSFVDATGAGDAFAAGFLHGLAASGGSLRAALKFGCAAGATCVATFGASAPLSRDVLAQALAELEEDNHDNDDAIFAPLPQ